jgi:hypothetical protein
MSAEQPDDYQSIEGTPHIPIPPLERASQSEDSAQLNNEADPVDPVAFIRDWIPRYLGGKMADKDL